MAVMHIEAEIPWRIDRADRDIALTLDAMLNDLLSSNELDQFLRERGWTAHGTRDSAESVRFDVPFIPALVRSHDSTTAVHR